jgi:hypothetical protein
MVGIKEFREQNYLKKEKVADGDLNPIKTNPAILKQLLLQLPLIS